MLLRPPLSTLFPYTTLFRSFSIARIFERENGRFSGGGAYEREVAPGGRRENRAAHRDVGAGGGLDSHGKDSRRKNGLWRSLLFEIRAGAIPKAQMTPRNC